MNIYGAPTIGSALFGAVLSAAKSPVLAERKAGDYYALIASYGIDPAFPLSIFAHESTYGTNAKAVVNRYGTRNWSNTRSQRKPGLSATIVQTDRGNFAKYPTWYASLDDLCYRLSDPAYVYQQRGARTVETVVPIMAPPGDFDNDPTSYVRGVLAQIAAWQARDTEIGKGTIVSPSIVIPKPPMVISHTPSKFGYSKGTREQLMICDHITAAGKAAYGRDTPSLSWLRDEIEGSPSVNYLIGRSGVTVEVVPPDGPAPWTNGIDYGEYPNGKRPNMANPLIADITRRQISPNQICITIEHEAENGGDMNAAQWAASIKLHIWLCWRFKITPDAIHIVGHNQWDGIDRPYCPGWTEAQWANLRAKIATGLGGAGKVPLDNGQEDEMQLPPPGTAETRIAPDGTPFTVISWGGQATKILGTKFGDVGVHLVGSDGTTEYNRSLTNGAMQGYKVVPK